MEIISLGNLWVCAQLFYMDEILRFCFHEEYEKAMGDGSVLSFHIVKRLTSISIFTSHQSFLVNQQRRGWATANKPRIDIENK